MRPESRLLILNPLSGAADHATTVRQKAHRAGFSVRATAHPAHGVELGREAANRGVDELAICGGDGTINEVLCGLAAESYLDQPTITVLPAGTANLLATNLGIASVQHGFELIDAGQVRRIDVGMAAESPFLVSCIVGLPADASTAATAELKERLGTLAFVVTGLREALEFEALQLELETTVEGGRERWAGEALCVLIGNARRFIRQGGQANMEDGLFDVAVVEQMPAGNLAIEAVTHRLLGRETDGVTHYQASEVSLRSDGAMRLSRDGELVERPAIELQCRRRILAMRVGPGYERTPIEATA
jgi:YegS/Rv2252/BmrU family lipid kinase